MMASELNSLSTAALDGIVELKSKKTVYTVTEGNDELFVFLIVNRSQLLINTI